MREAPETPRCCAGKLRYADKRSAIAGIQRTLRSKKYAPKRGKRLEVYMCRACGFWHLGHSPEQQAVGYR
jgi:rubrerythrin